MKPILIVTAIASLLAICSTASAVPVVSGHFPIPSGFDGNSKIVAGPDGNMWMTVKGATNDVARISPDGNVDEFELEGIEGASGIAVGPEKNIWVTQINKVASFSPADPKGSSKAFTIATVTSDNPIVAGPDGQMWVAASNNVVHFNPSDPEKAEPISVPKLAPKDIDVAGSLLAIADAGNSRIVTVTTSGTLHEYPLVGEFASSQGVAGGPSGQIAFSQQTQPEGLGLLTPPNAPTMIPMEGDPFGVALGSDGAFWFAMSAADGLERLTPGGSATALSGFPPKFFPRQIAAGPNNTLWVTMEIPGENVFEVGRVSGLEPPVGPGGNQGAPQTKIAKGPKKKVKTKGRFAKVTFRFSSTTAGATFECALTKSKRKAKRPAKPRFKACKSPKSYKLKPGKYSFSVRALSNGVADSTPATSSFRVIHIH